MAMNSLSRISVLAWALFVTSASYGRSPICGGGMLATSCESIKIQATNTLSTKDISNLLSEADRLFRSGKKEAAAQLGDLALALVQKEYGSKSKEEALLLCYVANYYNDHNTLKAIEYGQKALLMLNSVSDVQKDDFFYVYKGLAASYFRISDFKNSSLYTSKALDCAKITFGEQSDEYIDLLLQMGMYTNVEDRDRYAEEASKLAKQFYGNNSLQYADFLYRSTLLDDKTGKQTINKLIECCNIFESKKITSVKTYAECLKKLALEYIMIGNFDKAIGTTVKYGEMIKDIYGEKSLLYADYLEQIAECYKIYSSESSKNTYEQYHRALSSLEKATECSGQDYAMFLLHAASSCRVYGCELKKEGVANADSILMQGRDEAVRAIDCLKKASGEENSFVYLANCSLCAIYRDLGDINTALTIADKNATLASKIYGHESREHLKALCNIASLYENASKYDSAIEIHEKVKTLCNKLDGTNTSQVKFDNISGWLSCLYNMNDTTELMPLSKEYLNGLKTNLKHDFLFMTSEEQSLYWTNTLQNNKLALLLNWKNLGNICAPMADICFDAVLFSKGILLNSELDVNEAIRSNAEYQELYNEIKNDRSHLDQLTRQGLSETEANVKRSEIYDKENLLVKKLSSESQYLRNFDLTVDDIKKQLGANEAAVEFYDDLGTYYAFVVSPTEQHVRVRKLCHEFDIESLKGKSCSQDSLYNLIWKPLEADLANAKRVFFSPTGKLYSLAIECTDAHSDRIYHRYSSLQRLCCPATKGLSGKAVVYGGINYDGSSSSPNTDKHTANQKNASRLRGTMDYLPASYSEACEVAGLLRKQGKSVTLLSGDAATEKSFADLSHASVDILHISTHGFYWSADKYEKLVSENPYLNQGKKFTLIEDAAMARTGILFAGANAVFSHNATSQNDNDGIVSAKDICFLDFKGIDMVVLSACKTGLGDVAYEGVFGLQRAFKKAGAGSIVMSLWNVDDNVTQEFMTLLYSNLGKGYTKEAAIENARRKLKTKYPNFKDWAAFVLLD